MNDYMEKHLRIKTESDKNLAITLEHLVVNIDGIVEDTVNTIGEGFKRLTWRTSYFFDEYKDVHEQINTEDLRFAKAIWQVGKNKNVISVMIKVYIEMLLENSDSKRLERITRKVAHLSSTISSVQLTHKAIVFLIYNQVIIHLFRNEIIRKRMVAISNVPLTCLRLYGYIEEAAIAASDLKRKSPKYYLALYNMEIEMLYFIINPVLTNLVLAIEHKLDEMEVVDVLNKIFDGF